MLFTVGFGYFYATTSSQLRGEQAASQAASSQAQKLFATVQLLVYGAVFSNQLEFYVNNSGTAESIVAYWVLNGTSAQVVQYRNSSTLNILPYNLNQGQSTNPPIDTNISVTSISTTFVIKVLTSSGIVAYGAYPNQYVSAQTLNAEVASGIGSALISFGTFYWYDYLSGPPQQDSDGDFNEICAGGIQCNGGTWQIDIAHPHSGPLVPEGQNHTNDGCGYCGIMDPIVFSVNVTNQDSQQADLVINDQANLWVVETCDAGTPTSHCGVTSPVYVFYAVNMNSAGVIQSTAKGSFKQIQIPYGVTKTLYFAAAYPLHSHALQEMSLSTDDSTVPGNNLAYYGQFAIFMLLPGTRIPPGQVLVYGQNIPFESTIAGDNIGWYNESPTICTGGQYTPFQLTVNNSWFSGANVSQITLNASSFSSVAAGAPTGWSQSVSSGIITWTNTNVNNLITFGRNLTFTWAGFAPSVNTATQEVFPMAVYWNSGALTELQGASACFVNAGSQYPPPKVVPSGIIHYVPIILTNLQTSPVSGGTPVQLTVNWNSYNAYLDNPVDNVLFFDYSGNSLNAWMESGTSSSSTSSAIWLKLNSSGIQPTTSITVYMGFYAKGTSYLSSSGPFGEAPQLTGTYGQYDDGSSVFLYYNNGKSTAGLNVVNGGTVATSALGNPYGGTSGVLVLTGKGNTGTSSETVAWYTSSVVGDNFTAEGWININTNLNGLFALRGASSATNTNYLMGDGWGGPESSVAYESGTTNNVLSGSGTRSAGWRWDQVSVSGSSFTVSVYSNEPYIGGAQSSTTTTSDNTLGAGNKYVGIGTWAGANSPADFFGWRIRISPPAGTMPSTLFGPLF